jgi:SAM-dependent methyltransferase
MLRYIGNQFKKPSGLLGRIISQVMIKGNMCEYERIIPELEIRQNDQILEIGYGHGLGVDRISSIYDCYIAGIDFSELMYRQATKRNWKHIQNKKVELYFGDFLKSEIAQNQYDKVFCLNVIYFWDTLDEPFSRIKTVLKDGGLLRMFMAHRDFLNKVKFTKDGIFNKYSIDEVVDRLKFAGFAEITYNLENNGYIIKCKK